MSQILSPLPTRPEPEKATSSESLPTSSFQVPHESAIAHVGGEAKFVDDLPSSKDEVWVDYIPSPSAHGKILTHNFEELKQIPGILGIFTFQDLPGNNHFGNIISDEPFLAENRVHYVGQPVAVIASENEEAALLARKRVRFEIEELEPVFTIDQALAKEEFLGVPRKIERGDFEKAWEEAERRLEGTFHCNGQEHFYLESQAVLVVPGEEDQLHVHSSTQNTSEIQQVVAEALNLGFHQVVAVCKRMGGGFGGKETQAAIPAVMASLVAYHLKRPARMVFTKDDDMKTTGKRHPFLIRYKSAYTSEGRITGLEVKLFSNGGAYADLSTAIMERAMLHSDNAYFIPNVLIKGQVCRTNLPPNTALRGFGGPQGMANIENIMQEIAITLGKDAFEVRRLNCYGKYEQNVTPYGQKVHAHCLPEMMDRLAEKTDYQKRLSAIEAFNKASKTHLRGIALTPMKFGISFTTTFLNQGNALVNLYLDGTVQVSTGGTEMGQGLNTKIRLIVAGELGVEYDSVRVMETSTEKNNNTAPTAASAGTDLNGMAAADACSRLKQRLAEVASRMFANSLQNLEANEADVIFEKGLVWDQRHPKKKIKFAEVVNQAWLERISLGEKGFYRTPNIHYDRESGQGNPFFYYTSGASVSEVLIDRFTGELKLEKADLVLDIGKPIHEGIDLGQTYGGFVQGLGWLTTEELRYAENGSLLSYSPTTYKIPNISDIPEEFSVEFVDNPEHKINIWRSKAVGEPPLMLSLSVWLAVKHALSCLKEKQIPKLNIPATGEEILRRMDEIHDLEGFSTEEVEIPVISTI
ncbi:MAG: xanthine dehydrogenase molybdopterin binding subunit [bacterium]